MPLLLEGTIKVSRKDSDGDEILLYFIEKGDTCAMSMSCCMNNAKSQIIAVAETDTELIMVPISKMDDWMVKYKSWREFVLNSYQSRLNEVIQTVDSLAFLKMDERLLNYLQDKTKIFHSSSITITHEEVAKDFHTSRVVISRLLKKLEVKGDVKLHRNSIEVINL
jgi:CRP/FNR family transcriptional regulator